MRTHNFLTFDQQAVATSTIGGYGLVFGGICALI